MLEYEVVSVFISSEYFTCVALKILHEIHHKDPEAASLIGKIMCIHTIYLDHELHET